LLKGSGGRFFRPFAFLSLAAVVANTSRQVDGGAAVLRLTLAGVCFWCACFGSSTALLARRLCGNREWSLRPSARTTHLQMCVCTSPKATPKDTGVCW
jgi:hypothetical protein